MARTQRNPHELNAAEAEQAKQQSATDAARTLHDHAWQAHTTAGFHHAQAVRNEQAAAQMRQMAGFMQSWRRAAEAAEYTRLADEHDKAAVACRTRADHHHERGVALTAAANQGHIVVTIGAGDSGGGGGGTSQAAQAAPEPETIMVEEIA